MDRWPIVDTLRNAPGCDPVTGTSTGPFLLTDLYMAQGGRGVRFTPTVRLVERMAKAAGIVPAEGADALAAERDELRAERDRLAAELAEAQADYQRLLDAVGTTLKEGATVDRARRIVLRTAPGKARVEVP